MRVWSKSLLVGLLLMPLLRYSAQSAPSSDNRCENVRIGTYLIVSQGSNQGIPIGQLQLETLNDDGTLTGIRFLRDGTRYSNVNYTGRWDNVASCQIRIRRDLSSFNSNVLLTTQGDPYFSIVTTPGIVASERWFLQLDAPCTEDTIVGDVLSLQQGHQLINGQWKPNTVIQREEWSKWRMNGVAMSSYSGKDEVATYQGQFTQTDNCVGRIDQQDSNGVPYSYIAILRPNGKGYAYLQTQGDSLTVAVLNRIDLNRSPQ